MISIHLSPAEKLALFIKGGWPIIFLAFLVIGPILFQIGGAMQAFVDLQFRFREVEQTRGYVVNMIETNLTHNDYTVYQYDYTFPIGLETIYGTSFSSEFDLSYDQNIPIEYIIGNPNLSRIVGSSYAKTSAFAYIGLGIFLIAIVFIPLRIRRGQRIGRILGDGTVAQANYTKCRETAIEINEQTQYELTYEYQVDGETYHEYLRTTQPDTAEDYLSVIYSNRKPSDSILAYKLPYAIHKKVMNMYLNNTQG